MTASEGEIVYLDERVPLSQSSLWRLQREFFEGQGIQAWVNQVPFYITSNPFIANAYADICASFVCDYLKLKPESRHHPFYFLEPGTGTGRFSFYFIKRLKILLTQLELTDVKICYVMSDITPANLEFYEQHHALQPFIKAKLIDFALWNMETTAPIKLKNAGLELNPETLVNPLILLANYLFDTLSHDAFHIKESQLYELQLSLKTPAANLKGEQVQNLEKIETAYDLRAIEPNYYDDPHLDAPLKLYQQELVDTSLLYPIGSMRALQRLSKLAKGKLLVLSTDKGYSTLDALDHHNHPTLSFHGSFSLMVNFHALSLFCEAQDGDAFLQSTRKGIKTSCFSLGLKLADLPQTQAALERNLEAFSPGDYFIVHRRVSDSYESCELDFLAAHLHLTRWDPHMYLKMKNRLISLVPNADRDTLAFMAQHMPTLAANYYFLPQSECILFEIGVFFHALKAYEEAIGYYELSHEFIGEQFSLWYNIGLCWYSLDEKEQAVRYFKKAKHLNSESKEVKEWLSYLGHPN